MSFNAKKTQKILEVARSFNRTHVYTPEDDCCYVEGWAKWAAEFRDYQSTLEPVIETEPMYYLGHAWLTVNYYNAVVLNTENMLIADIDFGDPRLNRFAGVSNANEVITALGGLESLDKEISHWEPHLRFSQQSYRVYRTHSGCRVICTSNPFPRKQCGYYADALMLFLRSDRQYIDLCGRQQCYRARLTPKPWRTFDGSEHVCNLVHVTKDELVHPALTEQLSLHDDMTLADGRSDSCLA
jgi:hypothetical protein